ncbi:MAG: hypothetical protein ACFHVJ_03155 [Aestuariibacter sp.]
MKVRFYKFFRIAHKWAGLVLVLQLFFWIAGGVVMSAIPLEMVHGKHLAKQPDTTVWQNRGSYYSLDEVLNNISFPATNIEFISIAQRPVYVIKGKSNAMYLDAHTGKAVTPLQQEQIEMLAKNYYLQAHPVKSIRMLTEPPQEASRVTGTSWQVIFDDWLDTTLYLHPRTGKLEHVRSDLWRLFDFVWMLHIMDYDERENFNNPLLISFAIAALLFVLTGVVLLIKSFKPKSRQRRFA